ncbi:MAG: phospholipid carrier-dependent glycosyltransferase, partial [Gemmatimonadota bacterium]|nr:phospholipid carrier-dependent glycosyltransferase [Gemmatimonadota bacterium]
MNKKKRLLLCSILLLAALLRIYGIDWGIPGAGSNRAYHPDERMAPLTLSRMDPSQGRFNPYYFINPTLFYYQYGLFLLPVSRITGITPPWQIDSYPAFVDHNMEEQRVWYLTGRMLTVVMGLVTVWGVFWLGSLLAGVPVGVLGAAIFACLPAHVIQSHYMVVDAPAVMWMVLSLAFFAMALERKKAWVFAASGLFLGLGLATKYTVALIALPQLVLVIQEAWINRASGGVKKKNQAPGAKRSGKSM